MSPKLSVVVPVHNVEEHVRACLGSLAGQTLRDLEVIVVDDGSSDGSAAIARRFAAGDDRFRVVHERHQGPGPARNAGIRRATGRYLAFADADDVVPPHAYRRMVGSLERSGSDLATGGVERIDGERAWRSWMHDGVFSRPGAGVRFGERPLLVRDRCVWNKVFRRGFWDDQGLTFPDGLYEDVPVALGAHLAASGIDVLDDVVYRWRKRSGSITEGRFDRENFAQRVGMALALRERIERGAPALLPAFDEHSLIDVDVRVLLEGLPRVPDDDRAALVELGSDAVRRTGAAVREKLPALLRLQLHLLEHRRLDDLLEVLAFVRDGGPKSAPVVKRGGLRPRWYAGYPFFDDAGRDLPAGLYDVTDELRAVARVDAVTWADGRLRVEGHAYVDRIGAASPGDMRLRLWLVAQDKLGLRRVPITRVTRPDVTAASAQAAVSCDGTGFVAEIDPADLKVLGRRRQVDWRLAAEVSARGVRRRAGVQAPRSARHRWPVPVALPDGTRVWALGTGGFRLRVRRPDALVTAHRRAGDALEIEGLLAREPAEGLRLVARAGAGTSVKVPAEVAAQPGGGWSFWARVPLADLAPADAAPVLTWTFTLSGGLALHLDDVDATADACHRISGRDRTEAVVTRTRGGELCAVVRPAAPVVTRVAWEDDDRLVLTGTFAGAERPAAFVVRRERSGQQHRVPVRWRGDRFTAAFRPSRMPRFGVELPLGKGRWNILCPFGLDETPVVVARDAASGLPVPRVVGFHEIEPHAAKEDRLQLRVKVGLPVAERGGHAQARLRTADYPRYRTRPLLDLAVFDSFNGRQFSDNPRAIFEELRRSDPGFECVWVTADGQFPPPDGARTVLSGSREHYEALARARLVVGNWRQPDWFDKREGQTYVQCWHGTPLKKVGYDLRAMPYKRTEGADWMRRDVPQWDLLLAQTPYVVPFLRSAFRYDGPVLDTGHPRNDLLNRPERHAIALRVRERLGIPAGKKVVMYAPTWRDDFHFAIGKRAFQLELDLDRASAALGDDHVLLLRTHYLVTDKPKPGENPFVIDVSDYPDIAELYLVADVLVTDYSSSMFDFAVTGKPMLFYTYDLERYRDHVRGFYFDLAEVAPGPLLDTSDEVIDALRDLDAVARRSAPAYRAFRRRFCPSDDGRAAARVLARVLPDREEVEIPA
ncbi:CDP-glycerol glycerophosphotransferase family protein [Actinomadura rayongensis]|uniref:Glycosyltransferase n=1 Tax=Actinomadura rayongensis TaxID=1429076 RepID=A0A6I4VXQ6_9ACTN|nr:glycosyltransferase [Actinomadura rayongensis]